MGALHCEQSLRPPFASLVYTMLKISLWVGLKGLGVKNINIQCPLPQVQPLLRALKRCVRKGSKVEFC